MAGSYEMRIGFDESVPTVEAERDAVAEWQEACQRAGMSWTGPIATTVVRDDPARTALGEYAVVVSGQRVSG